MPLAEEATCRTGANIGKPLAITAGGFLCATRKHRARPPPAPMITKDNRRITVKIVRDHATDFHNSKKRWLSGGSRVCLQAAAAAVPVGVPVAAARARVSQRRRTVSSAALSTVKAHAVIHADPASGSAAPSTITAT